MVYSCLLQRETQEAGNLRPSSHGKCNADTLTNVRDCPPECPCPHLLFVVKLFCSHVPTRLSHWGAQMTPTQETDCSKLLVVTNKQILHCALTHDKIHSNNVTHLSTTHKGKFQTQCLKLHWEGWNLCFVFTFGVIVSRVPCLGHCLTTLTVSITGTVMTQPKVPVQLQCVQPSFSVLLSRSVQHSRRKCSKGLCWGENSGEAHLFNMHKSLVQSSELQKYDIEDGQFLKCQNYLALSLWEELVGHIGLEMQHLSSYCLWPSASESNGQG